jgi:transposase-like protein
MARAVEKQRKRRRSLDSKQRTEAVRLYELGLSGPKIALQFDVGVDQVYKVLHTAGVCRDVTGCRNRRWTDDQEDQIIDAYLEGETQVGLARTWNTSQSAISSILKRTGTQTRYKKRELSATELQSVKNRYEAGETAGAIAEDFDVFHKRILVELRRMGAKIRKRPGFHTWTDDCGRAFTFKSLWELRVAQHLDLLGKSWDYEKAKYTVIVDDGVATYTPDFWIYATCGELEAVVDVKGRWWPTGQQEKIELFCQQYPHIPFEIWDARVLKGSGVRLF